MYCAVAIVVRLNAAVLRKEGGLPLRCAAVGGGGAR